MTDMKSIRFPPPAADKMVRTILDGRKTVMRRVVKPQPKTECSYGGQHEFIPDDFIEGTSFTGFVCRKCGYGVCWPHFKFPVGTSWIRPPYRPGDILYVRETWARSMAGTYLYRATDTPLILDGWRPSIYMPREAARIFLRVTDVRVERLQEITPEQIDAEGCKEFGYSVETGELMPSSPCYFSIVWNNTIKKADRALYGWEANPWVWVIEFERISREEGTV